MARSSVQFQSDSGGDASRDKQAMKLDVSDPCRCFATISDLEMLAKPRQISHPQRRVGARMKKAL